MEIDQDWSESDDGIFSEEEVLESGNALEVHKMDVPEVGVMMDGGKEVHTKKAVEVKASRIGLGLFAAEDIAEGEIVREYSGEFVPLDAVEARRELLKKLGIEKDYTIEISNRIIDATFVGGPARFANHSCAGNAVFEEKNFEDGSIAVVLRATREIKTGEEILVDYKYKDRSWYLSCKCRSINCRMWEELVLE